MPEQDVEGRPDLVLMMTDQQRHDQLGYSSDGHFETPSLDALAASGVIFDTAYSASTVCVPARTALLTGLQPHRVPTQENGHALREGFWTVARELQHAGYETALIGKMHFAPVHAEHGFETMRLCEHIRWQGLGPLSKEREDELDDYHDWLVDQGLADYRFAGNEAMPADYPAEAHPTAWIEREVTEFLANRDRSRPLFLVVSFPHPHAPYDPPEPYRSMYDPADSVLPPTSYDVNRELPLVYQLATEASNTRPEAANADSVRSFLASVRGLVKQIDDAVQRLVPQLDLDRTVVFFTADHGDFSGYRGLMRKNPKVPFDDLARVPFFVAGAGIAGGRRVAELVQSCDVALTCLDYAGVDPPDGVEFDTRSLRPILDGDPGPDDLDRVVFTGTSVTWPTVRRGRYKYLQHVDRVEPLLFDLETDPLESVNLAGDPTYREVVDELSERLRDEMRRPILDVPAPR
jgi:arylsulfatase A-like enzyme